MLRAAHVIAAILMALAPAALAQVSSGHIDLEDMAGVAPRLVVVRVLISETDATCPQQNGAFRIGRYGVVHEIQVLRKGDRYWRMDATPGPDDFTYRRRVETDSCRIDIDISEQQKQNGEWVPLLSASRSGNSDDKTSDPPVMSPDEREVFRRADEAQWRAGRLKDGLGPMITGGTGFEGMDGCFRAFGTYLIDQGGVTMMFPTGLGGDLNQFFIERVDVDDNRSTLYLSRGACRVGFTIGAAVLREGSWVPLPTASPPKRRPGSEKN